MKHFPRFSPLTILVASMLVLLPVLAVLQYRWLGQLSDAEHERLQRTLRGSVGDLERGIELELVRILIGLQIDVSTLEERAWARYADRIDAWKATAAESDLVRDIWLAEPAFNTASPGSSLELRRWDASSRTFVKTAWPPSLDAVRARLEEEYRAYAATPDPVFGRPSDILSADGSTMVMPVLPLPPETPAAPPKPVFAFAIVGLDLDVLREQILPALVARHLGPAGISDYHVAVVSRANPREVIYEARPGDAHLLSARTDVAEPLLGLRRDHFTFMRRAAESLARPGERRNTLPRNLIFGLRLRRMAADETKGHEDDWARWRLLARHRAGSLEAAVAAARGRNLTLSFGLLLLMAVSVGLIVVAARRAERLGRQQMEFVAAVSHELRTPVSVIASAGDNLAQGVISDPARIREYGSAIRAEARRLGEMVERVLGFAGIQAGRAIGERVAVRPREVIEQAVAATAFTTAAHNVPVELVVPSALPELRGDPAALRSALENLIANAAKHGAEGGRLTIAAGVYKPAGAAPEIRISVTDKGPGVPPAERPRIFDPFFRGSAARARRVQGSGLGLSIVKAVAEAHGGRVSLTTADGEGCTFTLHLPVVEDAASGADARVAQEGHA